jgi:hypothetical protein
MIVPLILAVVLEEFAGVAAKIGGPIGGFSAGFADPSR